MSFSFLYRNKKYCLVGIIAAVVMFLITTAFFYVNTPKPVIKEKPDKPLVENQGNSINIDSTNIITKILKPKKDTTVKNYLYIIKVPTGKINTKVLSSGINKSGAMSVTNNPRLASWYKLGAKPGEIGSAVIAGHSGYRGGIASFQNLPKVKVGDKIYLIDKKGNETVFVIYKKKKFPADSTVDDVFNKNDGRYLNLITCVGTWNNHLGTHSERLVVYSKLDKIRIP